MKKKRVLTKLWIYGSMGLILAILLFLFATIFARGAGALSWQFLVDRPRGEILGSEGGIFPAIVGSLCFTGIAVATALLPALATAAYLTFYCRRTRLAALLRAVIQCIAGIPSIVLGLFGYSMLVLALDFGRSVLSGGLTLGVMILPFLEVRAEKALRELPPDLLEASYALGVSQFYTLRRVILPACRGDLVSGVISGACYAMGATAPLIFTGAVIGAPVPDSLFSPAMALPYHLYMLLTQGVSTDNAYATACVLLAIVLISNGLATFYAGRHRQWNPSSH
ncbi:MAG: ABC transporter permease subunit [Oscillospiraceae bacterium]